MQKIETLRKKIESEIKKLPLCSKLERGIIGRLKCSDFLENQLVRIFLEKDPKRLEKILENYKRLGISYDPVFKKINDNINDYPIYMAELQAAKFLIEKHKIKNVSFLQDSIVGKKPEFRFNYPGNSDLHYCEVKSFRELYPEHDILRNKLAAKSFISNKFNADFSITGVDYQSLNSTEKNYKFVREEVEDFVKKITNTLIVGKDDEITITTKNRMKISLRVAYSKKEFQFSFGGDVQWISELNAFEILHKAFSLLIDRVYEALQQVKEMKSKDLSKDIIVIYLNIDFRNKIFFDEYIKKAVDDIVNGLQLKNIITVEIIP